MSRRTVRLSAGQLTAFSLSSMIGMGIFYKAESLHSLTSGNWHWSSLAFLAVFIGVICLSLCILKLPFKNSNVGCLGWIDAKKYRRINSFAINYFGKVYNPIGIVIASIYLTSRVSQSMDVDPTWVVVIAATLSLTFIAINFISFKASNQMHKMIFIPVLLSVVCAPIFALVSYFTSGASVAPTVVSGTNASSSSPSVFVGPLSILACLPGILFIYDGFYYVTFLTKNAKEPRRVPGVIVTSFVLVTLLYIFLIVCFNVGTHDGKFESLKLLTSIDNKKLIENFFDISVIFAALLTLNAGCLSTIKQISSLDQKYQFRSITKISSSCSCDREVSVLTLLCSQVFGWFFVVWLVNQSVGLGLLKVIDFLADYVTIMVFALLWLILIKSTLKKRKLLLIFPFLMIFASACVIAVDLISNFEYGKGDQWVKLLLLIALLVIPSLFKIENGADKFRFTFQGNAHPLSISSQFVTRHES